MRAAVCQSLLLLFLGTSGLAGEHSVIFGKWHAVKSISDSGEVRELRMRSLSVDGRVKEYTFGPAHDVTDRLFVVQRLYRVNDSLPKDPQSPEWIWRLDGWISVDRSTGRVVTLNLPGFDPEVSEASWYRDYAAYCGADDDGKNLVVVAQLGKKKPVLRKEAGGSGCTAPKWDRGPSRVTFVIAGEKTVFTIRSHSADLQSESNEEGPQQ